MTGSPGGRKVLTHVGRYAARGGHLRPRQLDLRSWQPDAERTGWLGRLPSQRKACVIFLVLPSCPSMTLLRGFADQSRSCTLHHRAATVGFARWSQLTCQTRRRPTKNDPHGISCIVPFATHIDVSVASGRSLAPEANRIAAHGA